MKILIIHCTYNYKGGEDTVVEEEAKLLTHNGMQVETLLFSNSGNTLFKLLSLPYNLSAYRKTRNKIQTFRPDIIHIHNLHFAASPAVIDAAHKAGIPCVATIHNFRLLCPSATLFHKGQLFTDSLSSSFPWKAIRNKVYKNSALITFWLALSAKWHQQSRTWEQCSRLIVLTNGVKKLFLESAYRFREEQIAVKPNFTTLPALAPAPREDYFFYAGRLVEEKGIRVLLEAFAERPYELRIAGDGPMKAEVLAAAKQYPQIKYLGVVAKPELYNVIMRSNAFLFPSVWLEGMPLTIIEAFACSTPVIASRIGAMAEMIEDGRNGLHFAPGSAAALQQQLDKWTGLSEEVKAQYRRNALHTYRQHYTPDENFARLQQIYNAARQEKIASLNTPKENYITVETVK